MSAGGILIALAWALVVRGGLARGHAVVFLVLLAGRATREAIRLVAPFPDSADDQRRVGTLILSGAVPPAVAAGRCLEPTRLRAGLLGGREFVDHRAVRPWRDRLRVPPRRGSSRRSERR